MIINANLVRAQTPELFRVQQYTLQGLSKDYEKSAVSRIGIDYARTFIGGSADALIDVFFSVLSDKFCSYDKNPVVNTSNEYLARRIKRSVRTVQRTLQKLVDHGLLAYRDSGNCKRFQRKNGVIFGLDLTPLFECSEELRAILQAEHDRQKLIKKARKYNAKLQKCMQYCLDDIQQNGAQSRFIRHRQACLNILEQLTLVKAAAMTAEERIEALQILDVKCQEISVDAYFGSVENLSKNLKMSPKHDKNVTHHYNSELASINVVCTTHARPPEVSRRDGGRACVVVKASENCDVIYHKPDENDLSFMELKRGLPFFEAEFGKLDSWADLRQLSWQLKTMLSINQHAINTASERHSKEFMAACMAITIEKSLRDPDNINNPAGYAVSLFKLSPDAAAIQLKKTLRGLKNPKYLATAQV